MVESRTAPSRQLFRKISIFQRMDVKAEYNPLVSVIIPVKNGEATLDACLRSIRRSYYKNYEVLVVDDHSADGTVQTARRYQCNIVEAGDGHGANNARNAGAGKARGEIFLFLDSDV